MLTEHQFARSEILPSWYANALGRFLSIASHNFNLSRLDATHLQVVAGANDQAACIAIGGQWRYIETTLTTAHPGGAAASYDVYVTAANNTIVSTPLPFTDNTNYAFGLAIVASGATPPIVAGTVDVFRKVGSCQWTGAAISTVSQTISGSSDRSLQPGDLVVSAATARAGCLLCDGSAQSRTTYGALFAAIGTAYGAGNGTTTFNLPDFQGRTIIGAGAGAGLTARTVGTKTAATESHSHTVAGLTIPSLAVNGHHHSLSGNGGAAVAVRNTGGHNQVFSLNGGGGPAFTADSLWDQFTNTYSAQANALASAALLGTTDDAGTATGGGTTGGGTAAAVAQNSIPPASVANVFVKT